MGILTQIRLRVLAAGVLLLCSQHLFCSEQGPKSGDLSTENDDMEGATDSEARSDSETTSEQEGGATDLATDPATDSATAGESDSDWTMDSDAGAGDRDDDGIPNVSDECPDDAANNCLANPDGDFDGDGLLNGEESDGCESDEWTECAATISKINAMYEQILEESSDANTSNDLYDSLKKAEKDCEEVVRELVLLWNQREENANRQKRAEEFYYLCGWTAIAAIAHTEPVFDFDGDGCLPAAGFNEEGEPNEGLKPTGSLTGGCRDNLFLKSSTTLHRYACKTQDGATYCGHFYALYFQKDQILNLGGGHRHDWEYAAVWTKDGIVTHGSASAHGDLDTRKASDLAFEGTHLKIVYHKDGLLTHALRFAEPDEVAENPYHDFVTPPIVSWYEFEVDGLTREEMRDRLNSFDYGKASIPCKDSNFLSNLNEFKPSEFPTFDQKSVEDSNPFP